MGKYYCKTRSCQRRPCQRWCCCLVASCVQRILSMWSAQKRESLFKLASDAVVGMTSSPVSSSLFAMAYATEELQCAAVKPSFKLNNKLPSYSTRALSGPAAAKWSISKHSWKVARSACCLDRKQVTYCRLQQPSPKRRRHTGKLLLETSEAPLGFPPI